RRQGRKVVVIMFSSLFVCFALVLVRRYIEIGALAYPQPGTDYFALIVFTLWLLFFTPWLSLWESRNLRRHGLICPHCARLWKLRLRKKLLASGSCPYCHTGFQEISQP